MNIDTATLINACIGSAIIGSLILAGGAVTLLVRMVAAVVRWLRARQQQRRGIRRLEHYANHPANSTQPRRETP
ncbi:hypothetical protein ACGFZR_15450 [Streptomyces sp. NPDC048241]|uniref:hypothetical protein n=1 Tax=Streptomyces sp. NPDC048241 TaxID=3365521 RepID=UPI003710CA68